jgi:hypothetical protein
VATADFNGDGKTDLAVTNTADGTVSILMVYGNGTFRQAVTYDTGLGAGGPSLSRGGIGNPYLTLDGTGRQTIEDLTGGGGGQFRTITINKSGGVVNLACNPLVFTGLTLTAGAVNTGAYSWYLAGPFSTAPGTNLGDITVAGSNTTVIGTSAQVGSVTFAAANVMLTAPSGNLSVSGNWRDSVGAPFVTNGGTVVFDGTSGTQQLTSGGQSFANVTIAAGSPLQLEADVTIVGSFTILGTFDANGHKVLK